MTVHGWRIVAAICHAIVLSGFVICPIAAWAYEEATVSNGGTVTGTVHFPAKFRSPRPLSFADIPIKSIAEHYLMGLGTDCFEK